ncbi:MAG: DUF11 domain-containing protein [Phormidium tanganyikae FI6-MK23]|jgi:uncharacterized repeat protein (TIGR01451 family)|nr:DUF11 domain-containing protein [Phormidium tanganyikae FI6-MK23]
MKVLQSFTRMQLNRLAWSFCLAGGISITILDSAKAQIPVSINTTSAPAPPFSYTTQKAPGGTTTNYSTFTNYTLNFGKSTNFIFSGISIGAANYSVQQTADIIGIRRRNNAQVTGARQIILFQRDSKVATTVDLAPSFVDTMEAALLSNIINRGADNVFANTGDAAGNNNNIERIDFITSTGITAPSASKIGQVGFVVLDRGGNDPFKIAAITAINPVTNQPTALGTLVSVSNSTTNWGRSTNSSQTINTTVLRRDGSGDLQPSEDANNQPISGTFVSYTTLGITAGQKIYGYAIFPSDVTILMDLVGLTNVPTDTNITSGGLDLLAGGLSFTEYPTTDLKITKTDNQTTAIAGSTINYLISITNQGTSALTSIKVTDVIPTAIQSPVLTPSTGSYNSTTGDWTGLNLAPNTTITLTISGRIDPIFSGTLANTATVSPPSGVEDFNPDNNSATDTTTVTPASPIPNVRLVKRITALNSTPYTNTIDDPADTNDDSSHNWTPNYLTGRTGKGVTAGDTVPVKPGDSLEYTIYFLSDGAAPAQNVRLCDLVPTNTTFLPSVFNSNTPKDSGTSVGDFGIRLTIGSSTSYLSNANDTPDRGQFFASGTSAPCGINGALVVAPNGAITVNLNNIPNATTKGTPNSFGFIRFRAKVN